MPIGPQNEKEDAAYKQACEVIDDAIRYAGFSERVTVHVDKLPVLSWKTVDRLCAAYRQAGWSKVEAVTGADGREVFALEV